jgi:hypothetical protein
MRGTTPPPYQKRRKSKELPIPLSKKRTVNQQVK